MPDLLNINEIEYKGYKCIVRKTGFNDVTPSMKEMFERTGMYPYWFCGYVRIPQHHHLYGLEYPKIEHLIECHGGLTYSAYEAGGWTIGFDCSHLDDNPNDQNEEFTFDECKKIVDQLERLALTS